MPMKRSQLTAITIYLFFLRRLKAPAAPNRPVPSRNILVGSGTGVALPATVPCRVVLPWPAPPPAPLAGTAFVYPGLAGYEKAPIFIDVVVKVIGPTPVLKP